MTQRSRAMKIENETQNKPFNPTPRIIERRPNTTNHLRGPQTSIYRPNRPEFHRTNENFSRLCTLVLATKPEHLHEFSPVLRAIFQRSKGHLGPFRDPSAGRSVEEIDSMRNGAFLWSGIFECVFLNRDLNSRECCVCDLSSFFERNSDYGCGVANRRVNSDSARVQRVLERLIGAAISEELVHCR